MEQKDNSNSRRSFLKKAVIGGIATATTGAAITATPAMGQESAVSAAKPSWETPPAPIPASAIKQTIDADIVVVGAGISGLATAHAAAEAGAKVVLLEKTKTFAARGYANGAINTKLHKKLGINLDKEQIIAELVIWSNNRVEQKLIRTWAEKSGEVMDYFIDLAEANGLIPAVDPKSFEASANFHEYQTAVTFRKEGDTGWFYEPRIITVIEQEARKHGADIHYKAPAEQLVKDEKTGRIVAVIAKQGDGYIRVNAKKGVVLCTGDYGGNQEMRDAWAPILKKVESTLYSPPGANTGDGIRMAMWQGANIQDPSHPTMIHCIPGVICDFMANNFTFMRVNLAGERYENEVQTPQGMCDGKITQPGNKAWAIFDAKYAQDHANIAPAPFGPFAEPAEWLATSVEKGNAYKADTIEDLAKQMGVPPASLAKTVARYTDLARNGKDEDFGKSNRFLFTIEKAPYYALPIRISLLVTVGGLDVNGESEVLSKDGKVIPGLFAIGNTAGNFFANDYPFTAPGLSHGRCLTLGRLMGQRLAKA